MSRVEGGSPIDLGSPPYRGGLAPSLDTRHRPTIHQLPPTVG